MTTRITLSDGSDTGRQPRLDQRDFEKLKVDLTVTSVIGEIAHPSHIGPC